MLTNILLYTYDNESESFILKCTVPCNNQEDTIDCIKRPYSYLVRRAFKEPIAKLVVTDFTGDIIFGIDTVNKYYYNNINPSKYTTLYSYAIDVIKVLNPICYTENIIEW